jgi:hypothetical protein
MLEATLVLGMILQRFELVDHTNYELKIRQTLTIKPADFRIKVRARTDRPAAVASPPAPHPSRKKNPKPSRLRRCRAAWSSILRASGRSLRSNPPFFEPRRCAGGL